MSVISWNKKNGVNGASGDFGTGANWLGGAVPGSGDDASIGLPGAYTVTSSAGGTVTINGLQIASAGVILSTAGPGETFNITNGTDGGTVNGRVLVGSGDTLNILGNWSGTGRVSALTGSIINVGAFGGSGIMVSDPGGGFSATGTNASGPPGGVLNMNNDTFVQGVSAGFGGQIRAGETFGGTTNIYGGSISEGSVDVRAVDGGGTLNLFDTTLTDVLLDTTNYGTGGNLMQTQNLGTAADVAGTILDGIRNANNPDGLINVASLQVQDDTNLTIKGYIENYASYADPGHPSGYIGIFMNGSANDTFLWVDGNATLTQGGQIVMSKVGAGLDSPSNVIDATPGTASTLTTNNFIQGAGDIGTDGSNNGKLGLTNTGKIEATSALFALNLDIGFHGAAGTVSNSGGKLESGGAGITGGGVLTGGTLAGGLVIKDTNVSGGEMVVASDSYMQSSNNINNVSALFDNTNGNNTGLWILGAGSTLTGRTTISGFAGAGAASSDELDLVGIKFGEDSSATWTQNTATQGTLAVKSGNGAVIVDLTLIGSYAAGTGDFQVQTDTGGNTVVTTLNSTNALSFAL
jgi:hypothetical protein